MASLAPMPAIIINQFAYCHTHLNDKRLFDAIIGNPPFASKLQLSY